MAQHDAAGGPGLDDEVTLAETLRAAVELDDAATFQELLARVDREVPPADRLLDLGLAFAEALRMGKEPFVHRFVDRVPDVNALIHEGCTPLVYAAGGPPVSSTTSVVRALVDRGADVNLLAPGPRTTPLMKACGVGNVEVAELLVSRGGSVSVAG